MDMLVREGIEMDRQYVCESELPKFSALPSHSAQLVFCADKYCSPTRTAIQSGRNPYHVNPLNADPDIYNPADPVSGMASMPRNSPSPLRQNLELMKLTSAACLFAVTGMAMKMAAAGSDQTHMFGKWRVPPQPSFFYRRSDPDGAFCAQGCGF